MIAWRKLSGMIPRRLAIALLPLGVACGREPPTTPAVLAVPPAPRSAAAAPPAVRAPAADDAERGGDRELDLVRAPVIALRDSPARASAPRPLGDPPSRTRTLHQTARVKDDGALRRAEAPGAYTPGRPYAPGPDIVALPPGARPDIPLTYGDAKLRSIAESDGKLLLLYGPRYVAVVSGRSVSGVLDLEPSSLPLDDDDRHFSDVHDVVHSGGVLFVCRGYNAWRATRKGYVAAVDAATGELRWRSDAKVCGGLLALVGDYVITGYGEAIIGFALKLLRRTDGVTVQSIPLDGAALEFTVTGDTVVVGTHTARVTYELGP